MDVSTRSLAEVGVAISGSASEIEYWQRTDRWRICTPLAHTRWPTPSRRGRQGSGNAGLADGRCATPSNWIIHDTSSSDEHWTSDLSVWSYPCEASL